MISSEKWINFKQVPKGAPVLKLIFLGDCGTGKTSLYTKIDMISVKNLNSIGTLKLLPTTSIDVVLKAIKKDEEAYFIQVSPKKIKN